MALTRILTSVSGVTPIHPGPETGLLYSKAFITPAGQSIMIRRDPPDPTPTNGELVYSTSTYTMEGVGDILAAKFIPVTGTPDVTIVLMP